MKEELSLRERKKRATHALLMETALGMFEERGFSEVSVAEIAAAAEVSKATVFNYFPVKEDLVLGGMKRHIAEPARVVRDRPVGQTPHGALSDYFLDHLKAHAPLTGLSDHPLVLQVHRVVHTSSNLALRAVDYRRRSADLVAEALIDEGGTELTARLVASQLLHVHGVLSTMNATRIYEGQTPEQAYPEAVAIAERAFGLLRSGLGEVMPRTPIEAAFHDHARPGAAYRTGPCGAEDRLGADALEFE